jgi:hypothetical protein
MKKKTNKLPYREYTDEQIKEFLKEDKIDPELKLFFQQLMKTKKRKLKNQSIKQI